MSVIGGLRVRLASARSAVGDRNMARLLFSWGAWAATDWAFLVAVSVLALDLGGAYAVGLVGAMRVLPSALVAPISSMVTDRVSRPRVLAAVGASWLVLSLVMAWLAFSGGSLVALIVVVAVGSMVSSVYKPTAQSIVPQLVGNPQQLVTANSAMSTIEALGTIAGPALCGLLLSVTGPTGVFVVLAVVHGAAAAAGLTLRTSFQPVRSVARSARARWLEPLRGFALLNTPQLRVVTWLFMGQTVMRGFLNVAVILVATSALGGDEALAGPLFAAMGIGGLLGSAAAMSRALRHGGLRWFGLGIALWGLPVALIGLWTGFTIAWCGLALVGVGNALIDIFGYSLYNRMLPDHLAGRAWGAFYCGNAATVALGSLVAPALIGLAGLPWAMVIMGGLLGLAPFVLWRQLIAAQAAAAGRAEDVALLRDVPLLAPLSLITIERLARVANERTVAAGEPIFAEGDGATAFFVIVDGEASVRQNGRELRRLSRPAAFGEIGLLQSSPRTAGVVAETPLRLLAIEGESFVAAVSGHREADELARDTVTGYLDEDRRRDPR